ncbi:MAG TPA: sulfatase-like hydrolase/transferase [Thermoanaerobaculia bacterium]|nr:sulfatase-like hydrolase/transferase [Thermoanaerobaculia bacterium]
MSAGKSLLLSLATLCACARPQSNPPVVLISIDTLRADHLTAYGAKRVDTPAIDRLARDGIVFENAYAHVPLTLPSHVTMLTGRLPYDNGVRSNAGYRLERDLNLTLPRLLHDRGYATGGAVSAYVLHGDTGLRSLFDFYDDSMEVWESATLGELQRRGDETARVALAWLDKVQSRPFFLFFHLFEPHSPYEPVEPFKSKYASSPYDGEIATADAIVGRFFAELERRGLYDQSLIVLCGDHGEGLGDHGEQEHGVLLYREVLHVPLIVKLPRQRLAGRRVPAPAQLVDILPTIVGAVGAKLPANLPGISLIDLAEGRGSNRAIYSETLYPRLHLGWSQLRSLTDTRNHYVESPVPELFDVVADPGEKKNIRDDRRRESGALADDLTKIPLNLQPQRTADAEERARLAALGYLSGAAAQSSGPLKNPRDHILVLAKIQQTFVLNQAGRYRDSVDLCRQILRDDPDLVDVYSQMADDLRRLGRLQEALDAYREAIRRSPQLVDSFAIEIAKLKLDLGDLKAAELNAKQAMNLDAEVAHLILAAVAEGHSDWAAAEREVRLALGPESRPRVPALILLARVLTQRGKLDEALAVANRAATRVSEEGAHPVPTLASTRGDIFARMGRNADAEAAFRHEMAHFPETTEAYTKLALLLASEHRFAEIEPTLEAMVKASPKPATYLLAAREMKDLGNEAAARAFQRRGERLVRQTR